MKRLAIIALSILLTACTAAMPNLRDGAGNVIINRGDPQGDLRVIDEIKVAHGNGCGAFGAEGTYEGAMVMIRNRARELGGTHVRIDDKVPPHRDPSCFVNEYVIRATVYGPKAE